MRPFTVTIPIRGTLAEKRTMPAALRSAAALNPSEIMTIIDDDCPEWLPQFIRDSCPAPVRMVRISRDPAWKFHLARAVYEAYSRAAHDAILCFDCDSEVTHAVVEPLDRLGRDGVAVITFLRALGQSDLLTRWRGFAAARLAGKTRTMEGIYWIWRPAYMEMVDPAKLRDIYNGIDTYLMSRLEESGYSCLPVQKVGRIVNSGEMEGYPIHQFMTGIWLASGAVSFYKNRSPCSRFGPLGGVCARALALRRATLMGIGMWYPWILRGYAWALKNRGHGTVRMAAGMGNSQWQNYGVGAVARLPLWSDADRVRTGFPTDARDEGP